MRLQKPSRPSPVSTTKFARSRFSASGVCFAKMASKAIRPMPGQEKMDSMITEPLINGKHTKGPHPYGPMASYGTHDWSMIGCLNAASSAADQLPPPRSMASRFTVASTPAACSPPITEIRELGQVQRKRGS